MSVNDDALKTALTIALRKELFDYFLKEGYTVVAARGIDGLQPPPPLRNDGYGDQQPKRPDLVGYHQSTKQFMLGITRTGMDDLESETSLTEYNVFLDQRDRATKLPFRLCIIAPASRLNELTNLITRYIHPDLYARIVLLRSSSCE